MLVELAKHGDVDVYSLRLQFLPRFQLVIGGCQLFAGGFLESNAQRFGPPPEPVYELLAAFLADALPR